ncbi:dynein light chain Tctex-type protein 2B [Malaya genurostris]|uniref:dynein light chain Tctex-type protein 2B n=1 Tax=Malaya genurostris TaxID=325434 RepID=UPI0026F3ACA3|nr:dynein light chain Tctex-type protein 2B [Malaya genurostris]
MSEKEVEKAENGAPEIQADTPKKVTKKKIAILEPHEELGVEKRKEGKKYRKSVFPGLRESIMMDRRRSTVGFTDLNRQSSAQLFGRMMDSAFPRMQSRVWTSRRSTMYNIPRFQNNYRMESRHPFNRESVETLINCYLSIFLNDLTYNPKRAKRLAEHLSVELKDLIKCCNYDRYRIIALVTVGDKSSQNFKSVMRFLWDADRDSYTNFAFETSTYFVTATVFAVYYE